MKDHTVVTPKVKAAHDRAALSRQVNMFMVVTWCDERPWCRLAKEERTRAPGRPAVDTDSTAT
jgi:hypothetical protein